jgi:SPP1 gp7 family putative phage head morphogenesis protein
MPPNDIDKAFDTMKQSMIDALTSNAAEALIAGDVKALTLLKMPLNFSLISSRAVEATKQYRIELERYGGSDVVNIVNGVPKREFVPWLDDMIQTQKEDVGKIIADAIKAGTNRRDITKQLDAVFVNQEHNSALVAFQETKKLYRAGSDARYEEMNIQRFTWAHLAGQSAPRPEHEALDGQEFEGDDPIWLLQLECNCHCDKIPVLTVGGR